jgi:diaminohydroxyphosphoribosylaminopyrimidine deaminase/5-amino-6-(5-phosphoribosylamino)uracil reductase
MRRSIELARDCHPHPNPKVGAVIVGTDGSPVGEGAHAGPGSPHAEAVALEQAGEAARGGTLFVTLEPCVHHGRTPPCADAIIAAGVQRVVVALHDPDKRVAGRGIAKLDHAGIDVSVGVGARLAEAMDPGYFHHRRTGRPYVTLKVAATLDGQVAAADGSSRWITSDAARLDAHRLRADSDAVMVGAGTVRSDDPRLDVRLPGYDGRQPTPVIVAGAAPLPPRAKLLGRNPIVLSPTPLEGVTTIVAPGPNGVDLEPALEALGEGGVVDLLVEGGPTLAGSLLRAHLVGKLVIYFGSRLGGGLGRPMFEGTFQRLSEASAVRISTVEQVGDDVRLEAIVEG